MSNLNTRVSLHATFQFHFYLEGPGAFLTQALGTSFAFSAAVNHGEGDAFTGTKVAVVTPLVSDNFRYCLMPKDTEEQQGNQELKRNNQRQGHP